MLCYLIYTPDYCIILYNRSKVGVARTSLTLHESISTRTLHCNSWHHISPALFGAEQNPTLVSNAVDLIVTWAYTKWFSGDRPPWQSANPNQPVEGHDESLTLADRVAASKLGTSWGRGEFVYEASAFAAYSAVTEANWLTCPRTPTWMYFLCLLGSFKNVFLAAGHDHRVSMFYLPSRNPFFRGAGGGHAQRGRSRRTQWEERHFHSGVSGWSLWSRGSFDFGCHRNPGKAQRLFRGTF